MDDLTFAREPVNLRPVVAKFPDLSLSEIRFDITLHGDTSLTADEVRDLAAWLVAQTKVI